jgi:hypothetical protein
MIIFLRGFRGSKVFEAQAICFLILGVSAQDQRKESTLLRFLVIVIYYVLRMSIAVDNFPKHQVVLVDGKAYFSMYIRSKSSMPHFFSR